MPKAATSKAPKASKSTTPALNVAETLQISPPLMPIASISGMTFATRADSPFPDRYDLDAERLAIAELYNTDNPDENDPLYAKLLEVWDREDRLRKIQSRSQQRSHADLSISDAEAYRINTVGKLVASDVDTMALHTKDAYRLFMGRERDGDRFRGAVAGKRCAAALRAIWLLSGNDNPYADWVLVEMGQRIDVARSNLQALLALHEGSIQRMRDRGLNYSILKSTAPAVVDLGFQSPYGFMIAELIVEFDYFARVVKTLEARDKLSRKEATRALHEAKHPIRSVFETLLPFQKTLQREQIMPLSRKDWASADPTAKQRIRFAVECFGECPRDVFSGTRVPRHSRRRTTPNAAELSFLESVPLDGMGGDDSDHEVPLL